MDKITKLLLEKVNKKLSKTESILQDIKRDIGRFEFAERTLEGIKLKEDTNN